MSIKYPHHVGIRFTDPEYRCLRKLVAVTGRNQSDIIRFLVRTAARRPEMIASGLQREKARTHERT